MSGLHYLPAAHRRELPKSFNATLHLMVHFRAARPADLRAIVQMLADDPLGASRESLTDPLPSSYIEAFHAIVADPAHELVVAEIAGEPCAVLQITFIPYLTHQGSTRALIEGVRVAGSRRGSGLGRALLEWAISRAEERGCSLVQLTTDKSRPDALRFYEGIGFKATHEGMKLQLPRGR